MSLFSKIRWYASRLSVMGPAEILYRTREQGELFRLRMSYQAGTHEPDRSKLEPKKYLFCRSAERMVPEPEWRQDQVDRIPEQQLLKGEFGALGFHFQWDDRSGVWHQAPDTGSQWPKKFFASIHYRGNNECGDVRIAWEPSRLQHLVSLALLANRKNGRVRKAAVEAIENQLRSWVDDNPYLCGIHYISSMECALRIISVCHALDMTRKWLQESENTWRNALYIICSHAQLIYTRMSLYSSTGNHTIAECAGLAYAGILFPEFPGAAAWENTGLEVLSAQADRQVLPDGGGIEQAIWYHLFVADLCGLVIALCKDKSKRVGTIECAVRRAGEFLNTMASCAEELPGFGDSDNGYALSRYMNITFTEGVCSDGVKVFDESGISLIRQNNGRDIVFLDHGPLGMEPCYGHGHADGLSVSMRDQDGKLLDNAGTCTYTGDTGWREYFRGTSAHNTVCVDGADQALQLSAFMWTRPYEARLVSSRVEEGETFLLACHDGYLADKGVVHWRGIIHTAGSALVIWDYLNGNGRHHLALNWHAPRLDVQDQGKLSLSDSMDIEIDGGEINLFAGDETSRLGWMSDLYGVKYPCYTINTTYAGNLPHEFITRIIPDGRRVDRDAVVRGIARFKEIINEAKTN